jgi:hypothetical protein
MPDIDDHAVFAHCHAAGVMATDPRQDFVGAAEVVREDRPAGLGLGEHLACLLRVGFDGAWSTRNVVRKNG